MRAKIVGPKSTRSLGIASVTKVRTAKRSGKKKLQFLADHTGEVDRVLVDGDRLQLLANTKTKAELVALLTRRGPQAVCFRHPVDVRLATNGRKPAY